MSLDPIESLAVIPNPTDNFDEVWMVVNRANGRFIERMVRRLKETSCGNDNVLLDEQIFMDSVVSYDEGQLIQSIYAGAGDVYIVFIDNHGYSEGDTVVIRNTPVLSLSNTKWIIGGVTQNSFTLITQV